MNLPTLFGAALLLAAQIVYAQPNKEVFSTSVAVKPEECDCSSYPFKPTTPCYGHCVGKLASVKNPDLSAVKGLDPGVAVSIRVIAADRDASAPTDLSKLKGKKDLEFAAQKLTEKKAIRVEQ